MSKTVKALFSLVIFGLSLNAKAQEGQQIQQEPQGFSVAPNPILMEIGQKKISVAEFEAVYKKNNQETGPEALEEYLDLYVKFRLKVADAEAQGLDTMPKFKKELAGYRKQLSQPYLNDTAVTEALVREAYDRMQYELKARHILVEIGPAAAPKDTLEKYEEAMRIKKRIQNGADMAQVAREVDKNARNNGGDLGYFSALYMVYPFETACYNAKVNEVVGPVRTQFGYHIIRVEDRIPNRGEITTAHIMKRIPQNATEADKEVARMKIDEIYQKLQDGAKFEELAAEFSDDKGSANNGGQLPPFKSGRMVAVFESTAFALENDGDYSKPIETEFGYHIIKRISLKTLGSFDEVQAQLKYEMGRQRRSHKSKVSFLNRMKKEYGFKEYPKRLADFYTVIDSNFFHANEWKASSISQLNKTMFVLGDSSANQKSFAKYLEKNRTRRRPGNINAYIDRLYDGFEEDYITAYEDVRLEMKYPKFKAIMQEYHDGILLFDLTDEKVWSKAVKDSAGLAEFYQAHKNEYMWGERLEAVIYSCEDEAVAKETRKHVKARNKKSYKDDDILKMVNTESQLSMELERGKFSKGDSEIIDQISWETGISDNIEKNNRIYFVEVIDVLPEQAKQLDEVKGLMTSAYQNALEEEWIEELRTKYPVKIYRENLSLIK